MERDVKGIYARYQKGEIRDVAGLDLEFIRPEQPDLLITNTGSRGELLAHAGAIADRLIS
jgi:adenylylsulfate kinase